MRTAAFLIVLCLLAQMALAQNADPQLLAAINKIKANSDALNKPTKSVDRVNW